MLPDLDRQHVARRCGDAAVENADEARAFGGVIEFVLFWRDADRQLLLDEDEVGGVFVCRDAAVGGQAEGRAELFGEAGGVRDGGVVVGGFARDEGLVFPQRLAIGAPVEGEGPAGELLAGVPLALAVMKKAAGREALFEAADEVFGIAALVGSDGGGVPLRAFHVVDGDESRLAAHAEADIAFDQALIDLVAALEDFVPSLVAVGFRDARGLADARDAHVEGEGDLGFFVRAGNGCRTRWMRRGGKRDVAFAGEQAGRGVEADPACAGHIDFGPGMQIGEVDFGAGRAVERLHVRRQLDQVAGHEAGGETEIAQDLHQQPGAVAA